MELLSRRVDFRLAAVLTGAALAVGGVVFVELMLGVGWRPLGPLAWPGLGLLLGAALLGPSGAFGGALVVFAYYLWNLSEPQRFPHFFSSPESIMFWTVGLAVMAVVAMLLRTRLADAEAAAVRAARTEADFEALRRHEAHLRTITDNAPTLIGYIDREQRYRFNNLAYESWFARPRAEISGRPLREVMGEEAYAKVRAHLERALAGGRVTFQVEYKVNGQARHAQTTYLPDFDRSGRVVGCFSAAKDIGPLVEAQKALTAANERLEQALEGSRVALWDVDLRTGSVYLSEGWATLLGAPPGDTLTSVEALLALVHPEDDAEVRALAIAAMKGSRDAYAAEHRVRTADGRWIWILSRGRVTERDASGRALRMIGTNVDVSDRKRLEQTLPVAAAPDAAYAGVVDRTLLYDRMRHGFARARRSGSALALLSLNVDRFRAVNAAVGEAGGDAVLAEVARRLRACVRATDTVARVGGDEFMALLEGLKEREDAFQVAEKMLRVVREPVATEAGERRLTASIGVAFPGEEEREPDKLVARADAALTQAKATGRDAYRAA